MSSPGDTTQNIHVHVFVCVKEVCVCLLTDLKHISMSEKDRGVNNMWTQCEHVVHMLDIDCAKTRVMCYHTS